MKRLLFLLTMLLVTMQSLWAEEVASNQIWYTTTDHKQVEPGPKGFPGLQLIGNEYLGARGVLTFSGTVSALGSSAFSENMTLETVQLPSTVTNLGFGTFNKCSALKSVNIPKGVKVIGTNMFSGCHALSSIDIPDGVETIGEWAFTACISLKEVALPSTVRSIERFAFWSSGITSIVVPDNVECIKDESFKECRSLETVILPASIKKIESEAFRLCPKLKAFVLLAFTPPALEDDCFQGSPDAVLYVPAKALDAYRKSKEWTGYFGSRIAPIPDQLYYRSSTKLNPAGSNAFGEAKVVSHDFADGVGVIVLDRRLEKIGDGAFADSKTLTEIVWPDGVKSFGKEAFRGCTALKGITIPDSVTALGAGLFKGCSSLTAVICKPRVAPEVTEDCFQGTAASLRVRVADDVLGAYLAHPVWSKHKSLLVSDKPAANEVFYSSTNGSAIHVNDFSFGDAKIVSNVNVDGWGIITLDRPVTRILNNTFYQCDSLQSVTLPEGLQSIGNDVFNECANLTKVVLPSTLTEIGSYAFAFCHSLADVELPASLTSIDGSAFTECDALTSVLVPEGITQIKSHAFSACKNLASVILPSGIKDINSYAFYNSSALSTVVCLADAVPTVDEESFGSVSKSCRIFVKSDMVDAYKAAWPAYAHMICAYKPTSNQILYTTTDGKLLPDTLLHDFGGAKIVKHEISAGQGVITFDRPLTTVGQHAFAFCRTLATIDLPETVNKLGFQAFRDCSSLQEFEIPAGVTSLAHGVFLDCSSLTSIVVPEGVTEFDSFVFGACGSLKSVWLPQSLRTIAHSCFQGCSALESIVIPDGITRIEWQVFDGCRSLTTVLLPKSIQHIGDFAFNNCTALAALVCAAPNPPVIGENLFPDISVMNTILYVPANSVEKYHNSELYDNGCFRAVKPIPGQLFYTAERKVEPNRVDKPFGDANLAYNDFADGVGVMTFDRPLTNLGDKVFSGNQFITTVTIPDSVVWIGHSAFESCHGLAAVYCEAKDPGKFTRIGSKVFDDVRLDFRIFVPHTMVENYQRYWGAYDIAILPDSLSIPRQGWRTLFLPNDIRINEGLRVFYAKAAIGTADSVVVWLEQIHDVIPARTPVLISGAEGVYPALYAENNTAKAELKNLFQGTLVRQVCPLQDRYFVLSSNSTPENPEFVDPDPAILTAQTAYLAASNLKIGAAYTVDKITFLIESLPTDITEPVAPSASDAPRKVVIDGQIYIQHAGHLYNTMGAMVK
ncbi:MAG: leucine-rich repeat domain-containing protein [Bacteroidales bacterium]|nr:leucine-rich repeat domain-containing protein [Bacteroidales bacterium]